MKHNAEKIYKEWHEFAMTRQTEKLIELYAEDAIFESPLVPIIMGKTTGILNGKNEILAFFN